MDDDDFEDNVDVDLFSECIGASILNDVNRTIGEGGNLDGGRKNTQKDRDVGEDFVGGDGINYDSNDLDSNG